MVVVFRAAGPQAGEGTTVRGRQDLEIQGPRLNHTKEEKTSVSHGSDRRLDPTITPPMPLLEVLVMPSTPVTDPLHPTLLSAALTPRPLWHEWINTLDPEMAVKLNWGGRTILLFGGFHSLFLELI